MRKVIKALSLTTLAVAVFTVAFSESKTSIVKMMLKASESNPYTLNFGELGNNNSDIEQSTILTTAGNNNVEIKFSNVIENNNGWQIIKPNGYFYNPINGYSHKNKISGIKSIKYTSGSSNSLSLHYGYTCNNSQVIYTCEETINSNTKFEFDGERPSYFYIKNNSNSNISIDDFEIEYTCEETVYPRNNLKVLMVGNSFSDDTIFYASRIAESYGINLELYDAYIASCTIDIHYNKLTNNNADYSLRSMNGSEWNYLNNQTLTSILNYESWDIITVQQASSAIGRASSYSNLSNLVNGIRNVVGSNPKLYWYQTWSYDSTYMEYNDYFSYFNNNPVTMYNAINTCYDSQVASLGVFDKLIPAGTVVQNLRTSYMGETFTRDGKHMSSVHGRYLLGLNLISSILNIDLDLSPNSYRPSEINSSFNNVAYESIRNARKSPKAITNSNYVTSIMGDYDLSNYTEIDPGFVGCSFYNSTDSSNYNKRQGNTSGTSNQYVTTTRFTSSTLPVGSLVFCPEGFGYRPEAWTSDSQQSTRPNESYQNVLEIDSSFWNGYQYRAFNIFKAGKSVLSGEYVDEQYHQVFDGFRIFVPNASAAGLRTLDQNDYYEADKTLFTNNSSNIDWYERVHLDPIIGFYKCDSYYYLMNSHVDDTAKKFVCTRPFVTANGDLPENTVIIVDTGFQWRSDCWSDHGTHSRPSNVTTNYTTLTSDFMSELRVRTFNVSETGGAYVGQNAIGFINHMRIYVPINDIDIPVEDVSLNSNNISIEVGGSYKLSATVSPNNATYKAVTWSSSNTAVATVANDGTVTGVSTGNATITITTLDGGYIDTCYVEVTSASAVPYPTGTFKGTVNVLGNNFMLLISIGTRSNGIIYVRIYESSADATSITYNDSTMQFSITTTGNYSGYSYGTITGTYDASNDQLINISCNGSISSYISGNGSITVPRPTLRADCDGTTQELQSQFKRRYMSGSWQVDNSNADRLTSNTTEYVSGTGALKRRGYSGNAVALNFNNDFSPAIIVSNVSFWVYNPSGNDITLRMWGYRGTGLSSNFETGSVTARAGQWTYLQMGFTSTTIYNWQIADFQNTGVYLTFDEICLF